MRGRAIDVALGTFAQADSRGMHGAQISRIQGGPITSLAEVLALFSGRAGFAGKSEVSAAKKYLRTLDVRGQALASRVGRLSEGRNAQAHPDVNLLHDISLLLAEQGEDSAGMHSGEDVSSAPTTDSDHVNGYTSGAEVYDISSGADCTDASWQTTCSFPPCCCHCQQAIRRMMTR